MIHSNRQSGSRGTDSEPRARSIVDESLSTREYPVVTLRAAAVLPICFLRGETVPAGTAHEIVGHRVVEAVDFVDRLRWMRGRAREVGI